MLLVLFKSCMRVEEFDDDDEVGARGLECEQSVRWARVSEGEGEVLKEEKRIGVE
jgi:hypothetical protein